MKIKIKENPDWDLLKPHAGKWIEVETDHLFTNQYNTVPIEGFEHGARVEDAEVEMVVNDARIGKGKCIWCGTIITEGNKCNKKKECSKNEIIWFSEENTYFLKYPAENSIDLIVGD